MDADGAQSTSLASCASRCAGIYRVPEHGHHRGSPRNACAWNQLPSQLVPGVVTRRACVRGLRHPSRPLASLGSLWLARAVRQRESPQRHGKPLTGSVKPGRAIPHCGLANSCPPPPAQSARNPLDRGLRSNWRTVLTHSKANSPDPHANQMRSVTAQLHLQGGRFAEASHPRLKLGVRSTYGLANMIVRSLVDSPPVRRGPRGNT